MSPFSFKSAGNMLFPLPPQIEVVSFDVAGTLLAPHPSVGEVYSEVFAEYGFELSASEIETRFGEAFRRYKSRSEDNLLNKNGWRIIVSDTLQHPHHPDFAELFEKLWKAFSNYERWRPLPNAFETVRALHEKGLRLIVTSNNDERIRAVLQGHRIADAFEHIFLSVEIGFEKPDSRLFAKIQKTLDCAPNAILHIGDSEIEDIAGARAAGWHSIHAAKMHDLEA